jgi:hypothetical protein
MIFGNKKEELKKNYEWGLRLLKDLELPNLLSLYKVGQEYASCCDSGSKADVEHNNAEIYTAIEKDVTNRIYNHDELESTAKELISMFEANCDYENATVPKFDEDKSEDLNLSELFGSHVASVKKGVDIESIENKLVKAMTSILEETDDTKFITNGSTPRYRSFDEFAGDYTSVLTQYL